MRKLLVFVALGLLALAASCETLNIGSGLPSKGPQPSITVPNNAVGLGQGTFNLSILGGTAPFTVQYVFSGCVDPLTYTQNAAGSSDALTVTFLTTATAQNCTVTATVTDSQGLTGTTGPVSFTVNPTLNAAPVIVSATPNNAAGTVEVVVTDADNDVVTVTATPPAGLTAGNAVQTTAAGGGTLTFNFSAADLLNGGGGTITFTADDGNGGTDTETATLNIAGIPLLDDTIYAIPTSTSAAVGEAVKIIVATGRTANPFQYQNNVRVTFPNASGPAYVNNSFDTGAVDGNTDREDPIDGIWASVGASGFLLIGDNFIRQPIDLAGSGNPGRTGWDFSISPLDGNDVQTQGILFSFDMTFANPGVVDIGFQRTSTDDSLPRTYYQDDTQGTNHQWGDDDNVHNAPNSITVQ